MPSEASHVETVTAIGRGPARYGSAGCAVVPRRPVARHRPRPGWRCRGEGGAPHQRGHPLIRQAADVEGTQRAGRPDWGGSKPYQGTTERSAWQTVLARPSDASPPRPLTESRAWPVPRRSCDVKSPRGSTPGGRNAVHAQLVEGDTGAIAPGSLVTVRDEIWLVTSVEDTPDGPLYGVRGVSDFVKDTTASFYSALDRVEVLAPEDSAVVADTSPRYRSTRLWIEATLRKSPVPVDHPG